MQEMKATLPAWGSENARRSARFIAIVIVGTLAIPFLWNQLFGIRLLERATAQVASAGLNALGVSGRIVSVVEPVQFIVQGKTIEFGELCTGLLEFSIIASAIAATKEIPRKKRMVGVFGALVGVFAFNQLRVVASAMQLLNTNVEIADLTHNVLFRVFLFIVIAGMYWAWLGWGLKEK